MSGSNRDNATAARAKADDNCDNDISYILSYPPPPPPLPEGEREGGREGGREIERRSLGLSRQFMCGARNLQRRD